MFGYGPFTIVSVALTWLDSLYPEPLAKAMIAVSFLSLT